jgi:general nucleoside transport system ATP-binding protein
LVLANDHVDLEVYPGEILGLLGENGAGKSVLMSILYGLLQPTSGEIRINGQPVELSSAHDAIAQGIGMVHQHFMLVPPMTVVENIVIGAEPHRFAGRLDMNAATQQVAELSKHHGLDVDLHAKVEDIPVGMAQRVEILKATYREAQILVLDEPTAVLTPQEVDGLYEIMRNLANNGVPVIFITHKLHELIGVCDRITVMRRGKVVGSLPATEATPSILAEMMVGREVILEIDKEPANPGEPVLQVEELTVRHDDSELHRLNNISLEVRAGEIVGIAGIAGNGQDELLEVLSGLRKPTSGKVTLDGNDITSLDRRERIALGVSMIPQDRQRDGLILSFDISDNIVLGDHREKRFSSWIKRNFEGIRDYASGLMSAFDVRAKDGRTLVSNLSGGNQQKVVVAREMSRNRKLLIAAQPTRGVDVGAIEFIHRNIVDLRDKGAAVLLVSTELDEILQLSDRILVMFRGQIVGEVSAEDANLETVGLWMAGHTESTP